ncbi:MAG: SusC/RagA family TonB-linked outer membrane protein [Bacteroidales bacterium]
MKKTLLKLCALLITGMMYVMSYAQTYEVKGQVTDKTGNPLPGVNVVIKGTSLGTITDTEGHFRISSVSPSAVLVFSFVGMKTTEVTVGNQTEFNIVLEEELLGMEEVVVVGYGVQKKVNLTGSVASVNFSELSDQRPMNNVSSALAGLSTGVVVLQSNGNPGKDGATIYVRGLGTLNNNNPLVLIDGMEASLDAVNPNDIESISILKDAASAAIYGSRAANGVILVTTKKGKKDRMNVVYNGNFSFSSPTHLMEFVNDYATHMKLMNESARNIESTEPFTQATIDAWMNASKNPNALTSNGVPNRIAYPNTNWVKEIYQKNIVQEHMLSLDGGSDKSTYLLSFGYLDNPGLVDRTGIQRYNLRANLEANVNRWLTIGTRTWGFTQEKDLGNYETALEYLFQTTPGLVPKYNGKYGFPEAPGESAYANNIAAILNNTLGLNRTSYFNTTLYSNIKILKGLTWDFNFNYARQFDEGSGTTNGAVYERVKFSTGEIARQKWPPSQLWTWRSTSANRGYVLENLLRYSTTIADLHDINMLVGYNEQYYYEEYHSGSKQGLIDQNINTLNSATNMSEIRGDANDWALRSWFGRLNYSFNQKYLFEANFRYDGSSRFDPSKRWGLFPSFSAGWRVSQESFMENIEFINNLKLRLSWGKLGNNATMRNGNIDNYAYQATYGITNYLLNGSLAPGLAPKMIANKNLEWENTTVTNLGIDVSFLRDRLFAEIDLYNKLTDGILTVPPIYLTLGMVDPPIRNTAAVLNKGIEILAGWRDNAGDFSYSVSGNFTFNKNLITKFKGKLIREWRDGEYYSNLGDVSDTDWYYYLRRLEDHIINEYYLLDVYKGDGTYFNSDGSVKLKGGPKDGMIRTQKDLEWVQAMTAAGYTFLPNENISKQGIWYGDLIYADNNGDGIYGNTYDYDFRNHSPMPKIAFGTQISLKWKNFDLNMIFAGNAGYKLYWLERGYNFTNTRIGFQIGKMVENDHYYFNEANPSDPDNNTSAKFPRLKLQYDDPQNIQPSTYWLYDASYLKLKNLSIGYTLPSTISKKIYTERLRIYFSAVNLFTITSFPGPDPEIGSHSNYPIMRQIAFGTNITF